MTTKRHKLIPAVAYYRRSTKKQETSIADQRKAVVRYAEQHGYDIVDEFIDDGISGDATEKRHAFLEMRDAASSDLFDVVLCWDQDRFGRFDSLEAGHWCYPFRQAGVSVVTVNDGPIDWEDFTGRMMYSMKQEAKHQFLQDLSRNVLRGQIEAAKSGSWIGSNPYGYCIEGPSKQKRLVPGDSQHVQTVQRIFREYADDQKTMTAIARGLTTDGILSSGGRDEWLSSAVRSILVNPAYIGRFRSNHRSYAKYHGYRGGEITKGGHRGINDESDWIVFENHHEAIIDKRTFNRAQRLLNRNQGRKCRYTVSENPYLLSGLLVCGECGSLLWGIKNRSKSNVTREQRYECSRRRREGKASCEGCTVGEKDVLDFLVSFIESNFISPQDQTRLLKRVKQGQLRESDLPKAFKKLKRLIVGPSRTKSGRTLLEKQLKTMDNNLASARSNLVMLDPENIPAAQERIRQLVASRKQLVSQLGDGPSENDINHVVSDVLTKLFWLSTFDAEKLKPVLKEIEKVTIHAKGIGGGSARRYDFQRGEIEFRGARAINREENPD